jgi:hypothetical protein
LLPVMRILWRHRRHRSFITTLWLLFAVSPAQLSSSPYSYLPS